MKVKYNYKTLRKCQECKYYLNWQVTVLDDEDKPIMTFKGVCAKDSTPIGGACQVLCRAFRPRKQE